MYKAALGPVVPMPTLPSLTYRVEAAVKLPVVVAVELTVSPPLTFKVELKVLDAYTKIPADVFVGAKVLAQTWPQGERFNPAPVFTDKAPDWMDNPVPVMSEMSSPATLRVVTLNAVVVALPVM